MSNRLRSLILAILVWLGCFLVWAALTAWTGGELDLSILVPSVISGVLVAGIVSQLSTRWKKLRSALAGFGIGLIPSCFGLLMGFFAPRTIDASAMWIALSLWLAVPNSFGGALGAFVCARRAARP